MGCWRRAISWKRPSRCAAREEKKSPSRHEMLITRLLCSESSPLHMFVASEKLPDTQARQVILFSIFLHLRDVSLFIRSGANAAAPPRRAIRLCAGAATHRYSGALHDGSAGRTSLGRRQPSGSSVRSRHIDVDFTNKCVRVHTGQTGTARTHMWFKRALLVIHTHILGSDMAMVAGKH